MIERASVGLKRRWYAAGLAASCRGTGSGGVAYHRGRPLGHYEMSLCNGARAPRPS